MLRFKGPIENFKPSRRRILFSDDTDIPCDTNVVILLALKPLGILCSGQQNNDFRPEKKKKSQSQWHFFLQEKQYMVSFFYKACLYNAL